MKPSKNLSGLASKKQFGLRLSRLIRKDGRSIRDFSDAAGLNHTAVSKYCLGEKEPGRYALVRMANEARVSVDFLATGRVHLDLERFFYPIHALSARSDDPEAKGRFLDEHVVAYIEKPFVDQTFDGASGDSLAIAECRDDDMQPHVNKQEWIIVDTRDYELQRPAIFAIRAKREVLFRRLARQNDDIEVTNARGEVLAKLGEDDFKKRYEIIGRAIITGRYVWIDHGKLIHK